MESLYNEFEFSVGIFFMSCYFAPFIDTIQHLFLITLLVLNRGPCIFLNHFNECQMLNS